MNSRVNGYTYLFKNLCRQRILNRHTEFQQVGKGRGHYEIYKYFEPQTLSRYFTYNIFLFSFTASCP